MNYVRNIKIFLLCQGDIHHTKLLTLDIYRGDHPPITQKLYTLLLKHTQWVCEQLEMLEKLELLHEVSYICHIIKMSSLFILI